MSEAGRRAERHRQTLTQAQSFGQEAGIFPDLPCSFFWESDPTIVASSEGLIIQQSHCATRCFPSLDLARPGRLHAMAWWSFHSHQIGFSHVVIMHYYNLDLRNVNIQMTVTPQGSLQFAAAGVSVHIGSW